MITIKNKLSKKAENLKFIQEAHKYNLQGRTLISCTELIKLYTPKFDETGEITARIALQNGRTPREQADLWDKQCKEASQKGTDIHKIAQEMLEGTYTIPPEGITQEIALKVPLLRQVCEELKPYLIASEQIIYSEELGIAGTIDVLTLYQGKIDVFDFKTNKDEIAPDYKAYESMLNPLQSLPANNYYKYALQLSLYRYLLELDGYECNSLGLLHIKKNEIKEIYLPFLRDEVLLMLEDYKKKQELIIKNEKETRKFN